MNITEFNRKIVIYDNGRCDCGKFRGLKNRGIICHNCGIEVGHNKVIYFDKEEFIGAFRDRQIVKYPIKKL